MNRIPWDMQEAAVLLDGLIKVREGKIKRADAITDISKQLRNRAKKKYGTIDDKFRNENGITLQMARLEYGFTNGQSGMGPTSKWQNAIIKVFKDDNKAYKKLLDGVSNITNMEKNQNMNFFDWLDKYKNVDEKIKRKNIWIDINAILKRNSKLSTNIWSVDDIFFIDKLINQIENKKIIHSETLQVQALQCLQLIREYHTEENEIQDTFSKEKFQHNMNDNEDVNIDVIDKFKEVLGEYFIKGFRVHSLIDIKKFRKYYQGKFKVAINDSNEQIEKDIDKCGFEYRGKIYIPDKVLSEELRKQLFTYIENSFKNGAKIIYFKALFEQFYEKFLDSYINDADMLREYITFYNDSKYIIENNYFYKSDSQMGNTSMDLIEVEEIRSCLKNHVLPMKIKEIHKELPHITEKQIRNILGRYHEFARNKKCEYFHADCFDVSEEDLENITVLIYSEIKKHEFITGNELYDMISNKYPYIYEQNSVYSPLGWRNALWYKLGDKFSFNSNIISDKYKDLAMKDVFLYYAQKRKNFTLQDIQQFADSIGSTTIYFESLYQKSARISEDRFVQKDDLIFNVSETDKVLSKFCTGDYIPIAEISNYGILPDASYPWNTYLLETYIAFYSKKYYLLHTGYNQYMVLGSMVDKSSDIKDFSMLITRVIADAKVPLEKEAALSYLCDKGYIGRRSYRGIEKILINARTIRNRKEK
ncbi:hypothetical protein [Mitsuokella sp. WILCCON 0060]|uniref:hypothetical protein n=1 Tax=unclassified Mitsuokella TaxID=2637239 RepID=UPI003EFC30B9